MFRGLSKPMYTSKFPTGLLRLCPASPFSTECLEVRQVQHPRWPRVLQPGARCRYEYVPPLVSRNWTCSAAAAALSALYGLRARSAGAPLSQSPPNSECRGSGTSSPAVTETGPARWNCASFIGTENRTHRNSLQRLSRLPTEGAGVTRPPHRGRPGLPSAYHALGDSGREATLGG